jgi:hypothetical protein
MKREIHISLYETNDDVVIPYHGDLNETRRQAEAICRNGVWNGCTYYPPHQVVTADIVETDE